MFNIFHTPAAKAIFILCLLVSGSILLFYAKRHPHPKFRPKLGELVLVGMIFFGISVGLTSMTAGLFDQENLDAAAKKAKKQKRSIGKGSSGSGQGDEEEGGERENIFEEEAPPFIPEE